MNSSEFDRPWIEVSPCWSKPESLRLLVSVEAGSTLREIAASFGREREDCRNRWFHLWNTAQTDRPAPAKEKGWG